VVQPIWFHQAGKYSSCFDRRKIKTRLRYMKEITMFIRNAFAGTALFALMSTTALAGPATPEGADRLLGVFQTYLGAEPGVVAVAPAGETYAVTIDFAPFIAKAAASGFSGTVTPWTFSLADQGGGKWAMTQDQAFSAQFAVAGKADFSMSIGSLVATGVFDESLAAFTTSRTEMTDIATAQTNTMPDGSTTTSSTAAESGFYQTDAVAAINGGVDSTVSYALTNSTQVMGIPSAEGGPATEITIAAASYGADGTMTGFEPDSFYKLIAWFVAHPSEEAIKADQAGLKAVLTDGIPFFQNINTTGSMETVTVATPVGVFVADSVGIDVEINGVVDDGLFREAIRVKGLTTPEGLLPEWSAGLVPTEFAIDVRASRFNLAAPAAAFIAAFDLAKPEPVDAAKQAELMTAFMPEGVVDVTLAPGTVKGTLYELAYEGAMTAGPGAMPVGAGKVTMTGMDAVMGALQAGPPEMTGQMVPMLGMAASMGKPGPDGQLVWEIDATAPGTLLVNGTDLMAMMGGQ
jgi:hypothetical protein